MFRAIHAYFSPPDRVLGCWAMSLFLLVGFALNGVAKPDRKDQKPKEEKKKPIPNLERYCQWGLLSQQGRTLRIDGSASWTATGEIRQDGKIRLLWERGDGRYAHGLYEIDGDNLTGKWGYVDEVMFGDDGDLIGQTQGEQIRKVAPPMGPDI